MIVTLAPYCNDKPLRYIPQKWWFTETQQSTLKRFADAAESCSLIISPVCCQVTLVCCIFLFTGLIVLLNFVSVLSPLICVLLLTVNVYKAKLLFFQTNLYI